MSLERVKKHFEKLGMVDRIKQFEVSSATVALAAQAIGCEKRQIAKTLSFWVHGKPILIVVAGDHKIDNAKYKACFQEKAKMLAFDEVEGEIGHAVGGVCPFGVKEGVRIFLDESLRRFEYVYPAAGEANTACKMTIEELERCTNYESWIDVCKTIES